MKTFSDARARLTGKRLDVYDALLRFGPHTAPDLAAVLRMDPAAAKLAVYELTAAFHIASTGKRKGAEPVVRALTASEAEAAFNIANPPAAPSQAGQQVGLFA